MSIRAKWVENEGELFKSYPSTCQQRSGHTKYWEPKLFLFSVILVAFVRNMSIFAVVYGGMSSGGMNLCYRGKMVEKNNFHIFCWHNLFQNR